MFPTTAANTAALRSQLRNNQVQGTVGGDGTSYMQFDYKTGAFSFGREKEDITGEQICVNIASFKHGWTIWSNGKAHKTAVGFSQPLPMEPDPIGDDRASESRSFEARFIDDGDTILRFDTNSYGGRKGMDQLFGQVALKASNDNDDFLFPIVELNSESYKSKQGGTIHNPVFTVVGWMDAQGNRENKAKQIEADDQQDEAPRRRRRSV